MTTTVKPAFFVEIYFLGRIFQEYRGDIISWMNNVIFTSYFYG